MNGLMSKVQFRAMLSNLPASCVFDAIENITPRPSVDAARMVLLRLEAQGCVSWQRQPDQTIALTEAGTKLLNSLSDYQK